jgi:hypothetical protein
MRIHVLAAVAAAALLTPALSPAQSMGEAAAREKEKREKAAAKPPAKVITEDDLRKTRTGTQEFVTATGATAAGTAKPAEGTKPAPDASPAAGATAPASAEERAKLQAEWREALGVAQGDVTRVQAEIARLERALADNTIDQYAASRATAAQRLDEAKKLLVEAQSRVTKLQDQGRAAGF